jgi:hypothetical protein
MENGIVLSRQDLPKTRVATEKEKDVWQFQRPKCDLHTTLSTHRSTVSTLGGKWLTLAQELVP